MKTYHCSECAPRAVLTLLGVSLFLQFCALGQTCTPAPSGLVSWWPGEGDVVDSFGGNNGTLIGNAGYAGGRVGQAFSFDGVADAVQLGNPTGLQMQNFTIDAWIRRSDASQPSLSGGAGLFIGYGGGGYAFGLKPDGHLFLTQVGVSEVTSTSQIADTAFHHVALTKTNDTVVFYVDGVAYPAASFGSVFSFESQVAIGARGDNYDSSFWGLIDELDVFSRALSATEIQSIYNAGVAGKCTSLVAPSIVSQPTDQTAFVGGAATFIVVAAGQQPLSYQWLFNDTNLVAGAISNSLTFTNIQLAQAGNYSVQVSNAYGVTLSSNAVLTVNPAPSCATPPSGLVSWWRGEGNASDVVGSSPGTNVGNVTYAAGKVGPGFSLDGNGDAVQLGNPTGLQVQNFTIDAWIRRSDASQPSLSGGAGLFIGYGGGGYAFGLKPDGHLFLTQVGVSEMTSTSQIADTDFHHVALTKTNSTVVFYVDGVAYPAASFGSVFSFESQVAIGARGDNYDSSFWGLIDELDVFSRALSATEIQSIYNVGAGGKCTEPVAPSLISQPTNQTVFVGGTATFIVLATGKQPLSYQWLFNDTNVVGGAISNSITLTNAQLAQAGNYSVQVSNAYGVTLSSNAILTVNPAPSCATPASGLVSWWRGEGDVVDFLGGNNGTLAGNTAFTAGRVGQALNFDGSGDGVRIGNPTSLQLQDFTIEAWVKRSSSTAVSSASIYGQIVGYGGGGYVLGFLQDGRLFLSKNGESAVESLGVVTNTAWHHVSVTKSNGTVTFYFDGVADPSLNYNTTFTFGSELTIGAVNPGLDSTFLGLIDELSIYNRALSFGEIQAIYNASLAGKCPVAMPPFIISQPTDRTVTVGTTTIFTVAAGGTAPLSYQWRFNTTNITGATNTSLTLSNVQFSQAGNYSVVVSNAVDSVTSSNAFLAVNFPPAAVRVVSTNAMAGGLVTVPVVLVANGNENALGFSLNFSTLRLAFAGVRLGNGAAGAALLPNTSQTNLGRLGIAMSLPSGMTFSAGTQEVVQVDFISPILTGVSPVNTAISFGNSPTVRQLSDAQAHVLSATYANGTVTLTPSDIEGDVAPRPTGDKDVTITDWVQVGRFAAGLDTAADGGEFQRADCAPRGGLGDGVLKVTDWVQAGRYAAGLDPLTVTGGPTSPVAEAPPAQRGGITVAAVRSVTVSSPTAIQGLTATVPVNLEAQGNEAALGFSLSFDATAFTYSSSSLGAGAGGATLNVNTSQIGSGKLGVTLGLPTGSFAAGSREMVKVTLTPNATVVGTYNLNFGDQPVPRAISDPSANELTADYVPGTVIVNPPPDLKIAQTGPNLRLSWPLWAEGFNLQVSADLLPPSNWTNFVSTVQTNGGELVVTIPASETTKFFRLHHQ